MILFLDDDKYRTKRFKSVIPSAFTAETADQMVALLSKITDAEPAESVFLDHDLGGEVYVDSSLPNTGMEVVRWIVANKPAINQIIVHSLNHSAASRMVSHLKEQGYNVEAIPFTALFLNWTSY